MKNLLLGSAGLLLLTGIAVGAVNAQTQTQTQSTTTTDSSGNTVTTSTTYSYGDDYSGSGANGSYRFNDRYGNTHWTNGNGPADANIAMTWSGGVDNVADIRFQGSDVTEHVVRGHDVLHPDFHIVTPLPNHPVHVFLTHVSGRGAVDIRQQPSSENGYTTIVRIHDPQPGTGDYHFALAWQ